MPLIPQLPLESNPQYQAFSDYCDLGPSRTIEKLLKFYEQNPDQKPLQTLTEVTIRSNYKTFRWDERARLYEQLVNERMELFCFETRLELKKKKLLWVSQMENIRNLVNSKLINNINMFDFLTFDKQAAIAIQVNKLWQTMQLDIDSEVSTDNIHEKAKAEAFEELLSALPPQIRSLLAKRIDVKFTPEKEGELVMVNNNNNNNNINNNNNNINNNNNNNEEE